MNKLLAAVAILVLLAGCTTNQPTAPTDQPSTPTQPTTPTQPSAPTQPTTPSQPTGPEIPANTVWIEANGFNPNVIRIPARTAITWQNKDTVPHALQGDGFMSSTLNQQETFMNFFTTPGTYEYHCSIHPSMTGTIIVE